ncbi:MAG TPA: hypothetical protein VM054_02970 [bacterium]|nr:hypothetical protein [bacterium]
MRGRVLLLSAALALALACTTTGPQPTPNVPGNLVAVSGLDSRVDLAWREPSTGEPESYRVYRSPEGGVFDQIVEISGNLTLYTDPTAVNGTSYEYRVTALNGDAESNPSGTAWATPYYDFEEVWFLSDAFNYLPTEGDSVFFCTHKAFDDYNRLCRLSTDGEVERLSDIANWGYPAVVGDLVYTFEYNGLNIIRVWTTDLELVEAFTFEGPSRKELAYHDGELFTINRDDYVIDVLDTEGNYLRSIGERGHEGPGMGDPFGLDVSPGGTLYVVDQGGESLLAFDAVSGELVWRISAEELPPDFVYPADAAVAPDGFVYLFSGYSGEFMVIDAAGRQIKRVPFEYGDTEMYAAVSDDFTVAMAEGDDVGRYMTAYRPVGFPVSQIPPLVAVKGGGAR